MIFHIIHRILFSVEVENESSNTKTNTDAINYLNKTMDYEKCGNNVKIELTEEQKSLLPNNSSIMQNSIGYETPIKIQNKEQDVTTPLNEFPQYGYTDMNACKSK